MARIVVYTIYTYFNGATVSPLNLPGEQQFLSPTG